VLRVFVVTLDTQELMDQRDTVEMTVRLASKDLQAFLVNQDWKDHLVSPATLDVTDRRVIVVDLDYLVCEDPLDLLVDLVRLD